MNKLVQKVRYLKACAEDRRNYKRALALSKKKGKILDEIESGIRPRTDIVLYKHCDNAQSRVLRQMDQFLKDWYDISEL